MTAAPVRILLVDDDPGDVLLIEEGLSAWTRERQVEVVGDGETACRRLERAGLAADAPLPDLVILDLNLPRRNGREVFAAARKNPMLAAVPIAVLTTSTTDTDVVAGAEPALNAYLVKPMRLDGFLKVAADLERFYERAGSRRRA